MAAPRLVALADGVAEATVVPDLGGGLASYDLIRAAGRAALFRPCRDLKRAGPFDLANNLLVPWSNRISGGGFPFGGRFHPLEPNLPGEPYPIRGNGFSSAWAVENASAETVELSLMSNGPGPFRISPLIVAVREVSDGDRARGRHEKTRETTRSHRPGFVSKHDLLV